MPERLENTHVTEAKPLIPPREIKARLPLTDAASAVVLRTRHAIRDIIRGADTQRLLCIVGPCSIHDPAAALDYAEKLQRAAQDVSERLVVVMRTYFEKPRTNIGWKGLINDPHLDGSCDIQRGLKIARALLLKINALGLPCASEMLDPVTPQYIADLISWAAIGARTTESQTHREMASGLSMPVGFKNGTDGGLDVALNAMISASHRHSFLGIDENGMTAIIKTRGNPDRHIVLRGGGGKTNFAPEDVARAAKLTASASILRPVMVDCSHDNSGKDPARQGAVCRAVVEQFHGGQNALMGFMLESNLNPGRQTWTEGVKPAYGVSITDGCIGWEETERLLYEAAEVALAK